MDEIIVEKMEVFKDFNIPWSNSLEIKYRAHKKEHGRLKAEIYLDNLCQSYIQYALDHYADVVLEAVRARHPKAETIYADIIKEEVGSYGLNELIKANKIEYCGSFKGRKLYAI